ncbi:hypothetical protein WJX72_002668 [[Myrmecia] bisecta]|uniref:Uncharacterized protein n=1 Tax=[Myrmecia] bisecta TaxID=41462 RepID=A0AAW1QPH3_9CHLO
MLEVQISVMDLHSAIKNKLAREIQRARVQLGAAAGYSNYEDFSKARRSIVKLVAKLEASLQAAPGVPKLGHMLKFLAACRTDEWKEAIYRIQNVLVLLQQLSTAGLHDERGDATTAELCRALARACIVLIAEVATALTSELEMAAFLMSQGVVPTTVTQQGDMFDPAPGQPHAAPTLASSLRKCARCQRPETQALLLKACSRCRKE